MKVLSLLVTLWVNGAIAHDECGEGMELCHEAGEEKAQWQTKKMLVSRKQASLLQQASEGEDVSEQHSAQHMAAKQQGAEQQFGNRAVSLDEDVHSRESLGRHEAAVHAHVRQRVKARLALDSNVVKNSFAAVGMNMETHHLALVEALVRANESQDMTWDASASMQFGTAVMQPTADVGKLKRNMAVGAMATGFANLITKLSGPNPHFSPKEIFSTVKSIAGPAIGLALGAVNPLLGMAFTFVMTLIQGFMGNSAESPMQKLYKKIMKEVKDFVSDALIQQSINTFKVELAAVQKEMELLKSVMSLEKKGGNEKLDQAQLIWYMVVLKDVSELRMKFWGVDCVQDLKNKKCQEWHKMCIWSTAVYLSDLELSILSQIIMLESRWGVTLGRRMVEVAKHARQHVRNSMYVCKEARFKKLRTYQTEDPKTIFHDTFYSPVKHFTSFDKWMEQVKSITNAMEKKISFWVDHFDKIYFAHRPDAKTDVSLITSFDPSGLCHGHRCVAHTWLRRKGPAEMMKGMWIANAKEAVQQGIRFFAQRTMKGNNLKFQCTENWQNRGFNSEEWYDKKKNYDNLLSLGCPPGFFVNDLYMSGGSRMDNIEAVRCCKPVSTSDQWGRCEYKTVMDTRVNVPESRKKPGHVRGELWYDCPPGMMIAGMDRANFKSWTLEPLYRFKCCSLSRCPAKCHAQRTFTSRSCQTCIDPKTSKCIKDGVDCPVGSLSCSACDGVVSRGCSAKLYAYSNFAYGDETHSVYLNEKGSPYCDPPGHGCRALPNFGHQEARDRGKHGNLVGSLVVEGSEGCKLTIDDRSSNSRFTFRVGEYTGRSLRHGNWPYLIPRRVALELECYVIIYNRPGWRDPLPPLEPGIYSREELNKLGVKGKNKQFKVVKYETKKKCVFRLLGHNYALLKKWYGPSNSHWWGSTPAYVQVGLWS